MNNKMHGEVDGETMAICQNEASTDSIVVLTIDRTKPEESLQMLARMMCSLISGPPLKKWEQLAVVLAKASHNKKLRKASLHRPLTEEERRSLRLFGAKGNRSLRKKVAIGLHMADNNATYLEIALSTGARMGQIEQWIKRFKEQGVETALGLIPRVIAIINKEPCFFGYSQKKWGQLDVSTVYERLYFEKISRNGVSVAIRRTGYTWEFARMAATNGIQLSVNGPERERLAFRQNETQRQAAKK